MDAKKRTTKQEEMLSKVRENYRKLQKEVKLWLEEKASAGQKIIGAAEKPPYFTLNELSEEQVVELWYRLNRVAGETRSTEELYKLLDEFKTDNSGFDPSLSSRLYLALSGVAQLVYQQLQLPVQEEDQPVGPCPVCGDNKYMAVLTPPVGKRYLHCLVCSHKRPVMTSGCVNCGSEKAANQIYLKSDEFPGFEVAACLDCGTYFKQLDLQEVQADDFVWEDIRTLPLNYAAEQWLAEQLAKEGKKLN